MERHLDVCSGQIDFLGLRPRIRHAQDARPAVLRPAAGQGDKIRAAIKACDEALTGAYDLLYERAIDFGAHPNERSVTGAMDIIEEEDQSRFVHTHLAGPGTALEHGLKTLAQAGVCALCLFQHTATARFELLGVKHRLQALRKQDL